MCFGKISRESFVRSYQDNCCVSSIGMELVNEAFFVLSLDDVIVDRKKTLHELKNTR